MTVFLPSTVEKDLAKFAVSLQQLAAGRSNAIGVVTLATSATSTVVSAINCAPGSAVFLFPKTADAAAPNFIIQKQIFTASGTYTPSANLFDAMLECVGGGGGGGSAAGTVGNIFSGAGGGSGGYSRLLASAASIGASKAVTIGAAGAGGSAGSNNGAAGGDTSVGTLCIGKGGSGGSFGSVSQVPLAGAGGVAGTGDLTAAGAPGLPGFYNAANTSIAFPSGGGGSSVFGGGAQGVNIASGAVTGNNGSNYGGGGSGGAVANSALTAAGGNGSKGVVFITEFCLAGVAGPIFVSSVGKQTFTISHDSSAVADRTYFYVCLG